MTAPRILNVDDSPGQRYAMTRLLQEAGFEVFEADSAKAALASLDSRPEVVILDVHLPDLSGFEVCRLIKENPSTASTLVIQVSAKFVDPEARTRGLDGGADGYLAHPIEPQELIAFVRALLRLKRDEQERRLLLEREQHARQVAEAAKARLEFLAEASSVLASSLEYARTLEHVATLVVPHLADWCVIDLLDEQGVPQRLKVAHSSPEKRIYTEPLLEYPPVLSSESGIGKAIRTRRSEYVPLVPKELLASRAQSEGHLEILHALGIRSLIIAPMCVGARCVGAISFAHGESGRTYDANDLLMAEDLARRAAVAVENARLFEQAQRTARIRDELLAVVSHDLRNPLNVILTSAAMLGQEGPRAEPGRRRCVEAISRSGQQMQRLIQDLLDVASIELGKLAVEPRIVDIPPLLREVVETFYAGARTKRLALVGPASPPSSIRALCDPGRVRQILGNLVANAIKFTPEGGTIRLDAAIDGSKVRISVADTGRGIDPHSRKHLFERFWQAAADSRGRGLGLYIVQGLVNAHGGEIGAEPRAGGGTTFWFTVPGVTSPERSD